MIYFWNFGIGTPSISRERFELETSNLACRLITGDTNDENEKLGQRGSIFKMAAMESPDRGLMTLLIEEDLNLFANQISTRYPIHT